MGHSTEPVRRRGSKTLAGAVTLVAITAGGLVPGAWPEGAAAAAVPAVARATSPHCSLDVIGKVVNEPAAVVDRQTASWVLVQDQNWSAWVPNGDWVLAAGPTGADVHSPDNRSDASLAAYNAAPGDPYTFAKLTRMMLAAVGNVHYVCRSGVSRNSTAETEGIELTGTYKGEAVHVVLILSVYFASGTGEVRDLYTPASQWTVGNEETLMLILRRAIIVPESLTP